MHFIGKERQKGEADCWCIENSETIANHGQLTQALSLFRVGKKKKNIELK